MVNRFDTYNYYRHQECRKSMTCVSPKKKLKQQQPKINNEMIRNDKQTNKQNKIQSYTRGFINWKKNDWHQTKVKKKKTKNH